MADPEDDATAMVVVETSAKLVAILTGSRHRHADPEDPMSSQPESEKEKQYFVNIEGAEEPWHEDKITVPQIRELGGWDASQPVVEVNLEKNTERTLEEDDVVTLKPGHGFAKKIKFQRG